MDKGNPPHSFTSKEEKRRKEKPFTQKASGRSHGSSPITKSGSQQEEREAKEHEFDEHQTEHNKGNVTHAEKVNPERAAKDPRIQEVKAKQNKEQEIPIKSDSDKKNIKEKHTPRRATPEKENAIKRLVNKAKQLYQKISERKLQKSQTTPEQEKKATTSKGSYLAKKIANDSGLNKSEKEQPEKLTAQSPAKKSVLRGKIAKEGKADKVPVTKASVTKNIKKAPLKTK